MPWQIDGETVEKETDFIFWAPKSLQVVTTVMKLKDACSLEEKLSTEELMLLNCGVGEDSQESLGLQGDPTSPS